FSYGGLREARSTFLNGAIVPTAAERNGDFSQTAGVNFVVPAGTSYAGQTPGTKFHCDLATGLPTGGTQTNNVVCPSFFDVAAANIVNKAIPTPNTTVNGVLRGWQGVIPNPFDTDEYLGKVDHNFSVSQHLSASYYTTAGNNTIRAGTAGQGLFWALQTFDWRQHNANVNEMWVISSNKVNQVWLSFIRYFGGRLNILNPVLGLAPDASLATFGFSVMVQGKPSLLNIGVTGFFNLTNVIGGPIVGSNFYILRDTFSYMCGHHAMKFGGELLL